ncbi:MAG: hypothetical protein HFH75_10325 [Lachnospiraceae bacterium]|jgi:hypothetical protein|nr:hypothetical protein [Lachnospiraceae bacterium]
MEKSLEVIGQLQVEKKDIVRRVYAVKNLDEVYRRQTELNAMGISIYTDVAARLLPALEEDGAGREVWADISKRLKKLSFTGIPTASEIRTKYRDAIEASMSGTSYKDYEVEPRDKDESFPNVSPKTQIDIRKKSLPQFLVFLAAQGIAVPLVLTIAGVKWNVLAKVILIVNGVAMVIEIIHCFRKYGWIGGQNRGGTDIISEKGTASEPDYDRWYQKVIEQVQQDNINILNQWFSDLKKITKEEIVKYKDKRGQQ